MSINRVCISGNLTRDPVLRSTSGGMSVLSMDVAVNDRRKNQQTGKWEDYPNFVDCTLFGTRGEKLAQYLAKGSKVAIEGKLRYRSWNDQQTGQKRSALEVVVDELEFMSGQQQQQGYAPVDRGIHGGHQRRHRALSGGQETRVDPPRGEVARALGAHCRSGGRAGLDTARRA